MKRIKREFMEFMEKRNMVVTGECKWLAQITGRFHNGELLLSNAVILAWEFYHINFTGYLSLFSGQNYAQTKLVCKTFYKIRVFVGFL